MTESRNLSRQCYIFVLWLEQITHRDIPSVAGAKKGRGGGGEERGEKREKEKGEAVLSFSPPSPPVFLPSFPTPPLSTPATQDNHHKIQDLPVPNVSVQPILKCG